MTLNSEYLDSFTIIMFSSYAPVFLPECQLRDLSILLGQGWKERELTITKKEFETFGQQGWICSFLFGYSTSFPGPGVLRRLEAGVWSMTLADNEIPSIDNWNEILVLTAIGMSQYQAKWTKPYTRGKYCTSMFIWSVQKGPLYRDKT